LEKKKLYLRPEWILY